MAIAVFVGATGALGQTQPALISTLPKCLPCPAESIPRQLSNQALKLEKVAGLAPIVTSARM